MSSHDLDRTTAVVTGASRGFGHAISIALAEAGARVVGVARDRVALEDLHRQLDGRFIPVVGDAADPVLAGLVIDQYQPRTLVLNAGATPLSRPIQQHTWQTFSRNWDVDVQHVFHWIREALLRPWLPGSSVVSISSGAAVKGSPLSGGYAGAKATIRFMSAYAASESDRGGLGIRFTSVLPQLTPATDMGTVAVAAYARHAGIDEASFVDGLGTTLAPEHVGKAIVDLATGGDENGNAFMLVAEGLVAAP
jgi:NAD(P)-dependent dehydrogenase (short-subunit alcohol dehydrogenase family)